MIFTFIQSQAAGGFTGPLDGITLKVAFGLRRLYSAYSGSLVRIRRSSDNTEQDIGYDSNGDFDSSAFSTFIGAGQGFVRTWYDQSGNGTDLTQTTNGSQPELLLSQVNGLPSVDFNGSHKLNLTTSFTYPDVILVAKIDALDTEGSMWIGDQGTSKWIQHGNATVSFSGIFDGNATSGTPGTVADGAFRSFEFYRDSASDGKYINGSSTYTYTGTLNNHSGTPTYGIGYWEGGTSWDVNGAIAEMLIGNDDIGSTDRSTIKTDHNTVFGVTV